MGDYINHSQTIILIVYFTFCKCFVKLICFCFFTACLYVDIEFYLFLFCEKDTPRFLLEIALSYIPSRFSCFGVIVKTVITNRLENIVLFFFYALQFNYFFFFFTIRPITCELQTCEVSVKVYAANASKKDAHRTI